MSTRVVLSRALILGALAIVFSLALDLLKCNSLIEWNDHLTKLSIIIVLVRFGQFWMEETGQNRFYPVFFILSGRNRFWTEKNQPCINTSISSEQSSGDDMSFRVRVKRKV